MYVNEPVLGENPIPCRNVALGRLGVGRKTVILHTEKMATDYDPSDLDIRSNSRRYEKQNVAPLSLIGELTPLTTV